ncbi:nickel pincer cofactor biosynthesis protein LarB [Methanoregula sp.]|uniref:nickel pincer cofactor biosynthesis protein LarB n=1 Tax=Methanoregula sp. TaxID=2052170 RepID=UPI00260AB72C|nr:nickel pincer cofactor biosynthesis protein LarB [Methanoregula sp.]MDD5144291.1 nickel pincer cofactor biosynthesis protein LarB [Methanoregula sp.]
MPGNPQLQDLLDQYKEGRITLAAAAEAIEGLRLDRIGDFACIDTGRGVRCGMPEVVLAEGKDPGHLAEIVLRLAGSGGRCIVTRVNAEQAARIQDLASREGIATVYREKAQVLLAGNSPAPERTGGIVAIITAGTSDIRVAEEARAIAEEMGCEVLTAYDVGAAGIHRLFPALKPLLGAHAFVVCAGREGTLPAVVAGLVDKPVIGIPVSVGYGYMGEGRAALASMLQSCSVIAVVNIDAGFTGGAFAARIANIGAGGKR